MKAEPGTEGGCGRGGHRASSSFTARSLTVNARVSSRSRDSVNKLTSVMSRASLFSITPRRGGSAAERCRDGQRRGQSAPPPRQQRRYVSSVSQGITELLPSRRSGQWRSCGAGRGIGRADLAARIDRFLRSTGSAAGIAVRVYIAFDSGFSASGRCAVSPLLRAVRGAGSSACHDRSHRGGGRFRCRGAAALHDLPAAVPKPGTWRAGNAPAADRKHGRALEPARSSGRTSSG